MTRRVFQSVPILIGRVLVLGGLMWSTPLAAASEAQTDSQSESPAAEVETRFEQANQFYEQGEYQKAARIYVSLLQDRQITPAIYFNLGNAWFQSGEIGRALYCYRQAERLSPRDPQLRANLEFVQTQTDRVPVPSARSFWSHYLGWLNLNEWTLLTAIAGWIWLTLATLRQWRPALKHSLRGYTAGCGTLFALLMTCLLFIRYETQHHNTAVVVVPQAQARYGPLVESQPSFTLADGAEVRIHDRKEDWIRITDAAERSGWVRQEEVWVLTPDPPARFFDAPQQS